MSQPETQPRHAGLARRLADTRAFSETLCEPLTAEDMGRIEDFVRTVHHLDDFADAQLAHWQHQAFVRARQVFCVSRLWCEHLARHHGIAAQEVANGIDTARF